MFHILYVDVQVFLPGTCRRTQGIFVPYTVCGRWGISHLELVVELGDPPWNDALEARLESVGAELEAHLQTHIDFSSMLYAELSS